MQTEEIISLSANERDQVWSGLLASEIRSNYFADLAGYYPRKQQVMTWLTLFLSCGAVITAIGASLPPWLKILPPIIVAGISLSSLVEQNQKRGSECTDLHFRYTNLAAEYEALWNDMYQEDARAKLKELISKGAELSKSSVSTGIKYNERRMGKWETHVVLHRTATA